MDGDGHLLDDRTPGVEEHESTASVLSYTVGFGLAVIIGNTIDLTTDHFL